MVGHHAHSIDVRKSARHARGTANRPINILAPSLLEAAASRVRK